MIKIEYKAVFVILVSIIGLIIYCSNMSPESSLEEQKVRFETVMGIDKNKVLCEDYGDTIKCSTILDRRPAIYACVDFGCRWIVSPY